MSTQLPDVDRDTILPFCICAMVVLGLAIVGAFIFNLFSVVIVLFIAVPLIFIFFRVFATYFFPDKQKCPQCDTTVGIYTEKCPNCDFKLLTKCPKCQNLMRYNEQLCRKCGYESKKIVIPEDADIKFEYIQEPASNADVANFCPSCGARLTEEQQNLRFCERCGGRLK